MVEEAEGWHEDEGHVSTILSFLLNRDHIVSDSVSHLRIAVRTNKN
jgi:hypothetical protein